MPEPTNHPDKCKWCGAKKVKTESRRGASLIIVFGCGSSTLEPITYKCKWSWHRKSLCYERELTTLKAERGKLVELLKDWQQWWNDFQIGGADCCDPPDEELTKNLIDAYEKEATHA